MLVPIGSYNLPIDKNLKLYFLHLASFYVTFTIIRSEDDKMHLSIKRSR